MADSENVIVRAGTSSEKAAATKADAPQ